MRPETSRSKGEELSQAERDILALLCSATDAESAKARQQLQFSRWDGFQFDECECFLIAVTKGPECKRIRHGGGPFSSATVLQNEKALGHLDLWVIDGYLHSLDYMPFEDDPGYMPLTTEYTFDFIGRQ
ncbi:hypothetical protein ACX5K5_11060 [Glutamicibacter bergerei]|uniref:Uncharacterized protein n=1 Tax=Glutamicibacter ardleyensis TaxID=225894 RepID=A0ABQ2DS51_9MICC|nr:MULTISPECIES: hypothetical protein [Glutamicibacter]PCC34513.1 hypothetical protein CIK74_09455 [Glutamicibacter sp. BW77]GGJ69865.1 hypothetical protein GCM10007173_30880 [Glutamicibacter ardleyensis]